MEGVECKESTTPRDRARKKEEPVSVCARAKDEKKRGEERRNISVGRGVAKRRGRSEQLFHDGREGDRVGWVGGWVGEEGGEREGDRKHV